MGGAGGVGRLLQRLVLPQRWVGRYMSARDTCAASIGENELVSSARDDLRARWNDRSTLLPHHEREL